MWKHTVPFMVVFFLTLSAWYLREKFDHVLYRHGGKCRGCKRKMS